MNDKELVCERSWGTWEVLQEGARFKVKSLLIQPGQQTSLQRHLHRSEHWVVVEGTALITVGNSKQVLTENQGICIELGEVHRISNPGRIPLMIVEVQWGSYCGEDDIIRLGDGEPVT